ncbi:paraquat-inducible protein B [Veronia nyctiphanis]|uniref:Paraquat-inducible protein B n=1 Tax=Veronia nyctiphanis TaxID=1278244 RepID=A0A4V1LT82_9GAMM|nr:MlaD family protein [Veronia nyctiphanis]RXJ74288.1 paraquat-inducible protein B [Veronia nyctiphanis]
MSDNKNINKPEIKKDRAISPLWLFTLIAFLLSGWLLFKTVNEAGQRIQIYFSNAQGIEAGRTTIRYNGLEVGTVRKINLSEDLSSIFVDADIYPEAAVLLGQNTAFWLVKPTASLAGISGLDALVSGNYIAIQPGSGERDNMIFTALEDAPTDALTQAGLHLKLTSDDLGSLSVGSQVYYKKIPVGEVYDYRLSPDNQKVVLSLLINPEYSGLVNTSTRFWNVSGVRARLGPTGVDVQLQNLGALVAGGIAFDSPPSNSAADDFTKYPLFRDINHAERGIHINIKLPLDHGITDPHSAILFEGMEVGRLSDIALDDDRQGMTATASIDPSMKWLLTDKSEMIIEKPQLGLDGLKNVANFVFGDFLTIHPKEGEPTVDFTARTQRQHIAMDPDSLRVTVEADNAWGIGENTKVLHRGVQVGFVDDVKLQNGKVELSLVVEKEFKHLVKSASRFFMVGGITGQLSDDGIEVIVPAVSQIADPAISFTSEGKKDISKSYNLYKSEISARNAKEAQKGVQIYTLLADELPSMSVGAPVLHKNFSVGTIDSFRLRKGKAEIKLKIENSFSHLITKETVFWSQSGVQVEASLNNGLIVNTGSVKSIVSGGISFGTLKGVQNKREGKWKLYNSLKDAENYGIDISLTTKATDGLSKGSKIRFQGIDVGEITAMMPVFDKNKIIVSARIYPPYSAVISRSDSYFWRVKPSISLSGAKNLDTILIPYISVNPGKGKITQSFALHDNPKDLKSFIIYLESESKGSVKVGTPLLFREMEVGHVSGIDLGRFSDRVIIKANIDNKYRYLVRKNTIFWNSSGLDVSIGLTGAQIKSGTVESIIKGGIAFAIPEETPLKELAENGQHFLLNAEPKPEWRKWRTAIPGF